MLSCTVLLCRYTTACRTRRCSWRGLISLRNPQRSNVIPDRSNPEPADPELGSAQDTALFTQVDGGGDATSAEVEQTSNEQRAPEPAE